MIRSLSNSWLLSLIGFHAATASACNMQQVYQSLISTQCDTCDGLAEDACRAEEQCDWSYHQECRVSSRISGFTELLSASEHYHKVKVLLGVGERCSNHPDEVTCLADANCNWDEDAVNQPDFIKKLMSGGRTSQCHMDDTEFVGSILSFIDGSPQAEMDNIIQSSKVCKEICPRQPEENGGEPHTDRCSGLSMADCQAPDCHYEETTEMCMMERRPENTCSNNKVYNICGSACPATCENQGIPTVCTQQCVAGCYCPSGTVEAPDGSCVAKESCPGVSNTQGPSCSEDMCSQHTAAWLASDRNLIDVQLPCRTDDGECELEGAPLFSKIAAVTKEDAIVKFVMDRVVCEEMTHWSQCASTGIKGCELEETTGNHDEECKINDSTVEDFKASNPKAREMFEFMEMCNDKSDEEACTSTSDECFWRDDKCLLGISGIAEIGHMLNHASGGTMGWLVEWMTDMTECENLTKDMRCDSPALLEECARACTSNDKCDFQNGVIGALMDNPNGDNKQHMCIPHLVNLIPHVLDDSKECGTALAEAIHAGIACESYLNEEDCTEAAYHFGSYECAWSCGACYPAETYFPNIESDTDTAAGADTTGTGSTTAADGTVVTNADGTVVTNAAGSTTAADGTVVTNADGTVVTNADLGVSSFARTIPGVIALAAVLF